MTTDIKICGLSTEAAIDAAAEAGATHVGFVHFEKSPRHVSLETAAQLRKRTPASLKVVLLLVNADPMSTQRAIETVKPDVVQFHGSETPEWTALVRQQIDGEVWKAIGVQDRHSLIRTDRFKDAVDRLLYDAPAKALPGGTGTSFDWSMLAEHDHVADWGLAGGLSPDNVAEALRVSHAPLVDVSSGVESAPGVKDMDKIAAFCQAVRAYDADHTNA